MRRLFSVLVLLSLGCSNGLAPAADDLRGTWDADFSVPGASLVLALRPSDIGVTGTGTYSIEAGRSGTLDVTGTFDRPRVTLSLHYDYGYVATYTGTLLPVPRKLTGTITDALGHKSPLTFTPR